MCESKVPFPLCISYKLELYYHYICILLLIGHTRAVFIQLCYYPCTYSNSGIHYNGLHYNINNHPAYTFAYLAKLFRTKLYDTSCKICKSMLCGISIKIINNIDVIFHRKSQSINDYLGLTLPVLRLLWSRAQETKEF